MDILINLGGSREKFMYKQFKETLLTTVNESMETQKLLLDQKLEAWRGTYEH